jgi:hypothetical protein
MLDIAMHRLKIICGVKARNLCTSESANQQCMPEAYKLSVLHACNVISYATAQGMPGPVKPAVIPLNPLLTPSCIRAIAGHGRPVNEPAKGGRKAVGVRTS